MEVKVRNRLHKSLKPFHLHARTVAEAGGWYGEWSGMEGGLVWWVGWGDGWVGMVGGVV